jgi:hypothetical protein
MTGLLGARSPGPVRAGVSENGFTGSAKEQKAAAIAARLLEAAGKIRYGSAAVILKIHDGRIVDVTHTTTENTREVNE